MSYSENTSRFEIHSPLKGAITVPGDKSISHRSLMLASQALGTCTVKGLLEGEDVIATQQALVKMGASITRQSNGDWVVEGRGLDAIAEPDNVLDMGNSGTSTRLLMGLLAPYPHRFFFTGDDSLRKRPMARVAEPLMQMGANITSRSGQRLPCVMQGGDLVPITYTLPVPSAQVKSAVLLAGLNTAGITTVIEPEPSRDHTERMLQFLGFPLVVEEKNGIRHISITGQQQTERKNRLIEVPADPSSAAFPLVAALITPDSRIEIKNVGMNEHRIGLLTTLREMGAKIILQNERQMGGEEVADILVEYSQLRGLNVPASRAPSMIDEYPILAVAAVFAEGITRMDGLAELRVKESDRLEKIRHGLEQCGARAEVEGDSLIVYGMGAANARGGATVDSALDHRIAMSFLVMGLRCQQPVYVHGVEAIATSFPSFFEVMETLGARHVIATHSAPATGKHPMVIAIDGPAASGKGTLARRLASTLGLVYLDTGSLYRAVGMKLVYDHLDPNDAAEALRAAKTIAIQDLQNPRLRQERIGQAASIVSAIPEVRQVLFDFQREVAASPQGAVLDGRDIGTVICPDADVKIFITASLDTRAKRRHRELQGEGVTVIYESVWEDLQERDDRDRKRAAAPLVAAEDAFSIDTSEMTADEVFRQVLEMVMVKVNENSRKASLEAV